MKSQQIVRIVFSDLHLDYNNWNLVSSIIDQIIEKAKKLKVSTVTLIGDIFESRKAQPLNNLIYFEQILNKFQESQIILEAIPGNHDKVDLESENSYLKAFEHHPYFTLISKYDINLISDKLLIHYIPYFKEGATYLKYLSNSVKNIKPSKINVLLTHIGIDGVFNNDKESVLSEITPDLFENFDHVYIGHYHDRSKITHNIEYIGSCYSHNFGEDNEKGGILLYEDGSIEYFNLKFPFHIEVIFDLDKDSLNHILTLKEQFANSSNIIRFKFYGPKEKIYSLDINPFKSVGIDVKTVTNSIQEGIEQAKSNQIINFNSSTIAYTEFPKFCIKEKLTEKQISRGTSYIQKHLNL